MAVYAIISNGVVTNTIDTDSDTAARDFPGAIQIDTLNPQPGIGWTYANGAFTPVAASTPSNPVFSKLAFMRLFTQPELLAIANYPTNASLSDQFKQELNAFFQLFQFADNVSVGDPSTISGVELLEQAGLIGTGRAAQILASRN